ncbi:Histone H2B type 1-F/J/L [Heterocephalus glaber]|uniref:Histone H2B type 1-F/J/L n=1 Tax=Heterocephalus glaber TaxID=10181 RepID=G5BV36_HETGA|nr:Histone H2B type 1-F/J/L [Heterocephalus glaber]
MPEPTKVSQAPKKGSKKAVTKAQKKDGKIRLRVQGAQAGPPRHRHLVQGHGHHELLRQRHLRAHRRGGSTTSSSASPARRRAWRVTTSARPSRRGRSRRPCGCCWHAVSEGTKAVTKYTSSK